MDLNQQIHEAAEYILSRIAKRPTVGMILGSGLGDLADSLENKIVIPYEQIPHFPRSTVEGHAGALVIGEICGKTVAVMQGRVHYYEGYAQQLITMPVRVMKLLGVEHLVLTNAAGGVNLSYAPGDLMLISDHINFSG
ncbi:MAG: purine-nucleoside phosphorylase, partial [Akkermansia sp.]|nr:purine-nucleoside phosphorylase [Akkermansia sp.]